MVVVGEASALDLSLDAEIENRYFPAEALHETQYGNYASAALTPEFYLDWDKRDQSVTLRLFGRYDQYDDKRTHADVREAFYRLTMRNFEWRIGVRQVFWGTLESAHLVDVINQTDFVEDIDGEDKLGQPTVNLAWFTPIGTIDLFYLPVFRERSFAGEKGRPQLLLPLDTTAARADDEHPGYAVRYFESVRGLDIGLSWFHGTNRDPRFDTAFDSCDVTLTATVSGSPTTGTVTCEEAAQFDESQIPPTVTIEEVRVALGNPRFVPVYDRIDQLGLDLHYVTGGLSLKAEAIHRRADEYDFVAAGAGLEYTLYGLFGNRDLGLLLEYLYDERGSLDPDVADAADRLSRSDDIPFDSIGAARTFQTSLEVTQNAASFQDDLFLGTRLTFNDLAGSEILVGATRDLETGAVFGTLEASRRFRGVYRVGLTGRLFSDIPATDPLYAFRRDDSLELTITRFF